MDLDNIWQKFCRRNSHSVAEQICLLFDYAARNQLVLPWKLTGRSNKPRNSQQQTTTCLICAKKKLLRQFLHRLWTSQMKKFSR